MHTVLCMMTFQDAHCTSHPIHYRCKVNIFHEKLDTTDSIIATLYFTHHVFVSHFNSWVPQTASEQVSGRCHNLKPVTQVAKLWRVLNLFYLHFQQWYYHYFSNCRILGNHSNIAAECDKTNNCISLSFAVWVKVFDNGWCHTTFL